VLNKSLQDTSESDTPNSKLMISDEFYYFDNVSAVKDSQFKHTVICASAQIFCARAQTENEISGRIFLYFVPEVIFRNASPLKEY
jgi:hypothetical protein